MQNSFLQIELFALTNVKTFLNKLELNLENNGFMYAKLVIIYSVSCYSKPAWFVFCLFCKNTGVRTKLNPIDLTEQTKIEKKPTETFFKISSFVFSQRKVVQVLN